MPCTKNAASHATAIWKITINHAAFEPSSLLTVAIAATHGVYNRVKIKKTKAVCGVKMLPRAALSPDVVVPIKTAVVDTTASFAENPAIKAVVICQFPKPRGAKTGASIRPMAASMLSPLSATTLNFKSNV